MSLLDKATEDVVIYPEIEFLDADGNVMTGPSPTGIPARAVIQMVSQGSPDRADPELKGFESVQDFRMKLPRSYTEIIGAQAQVEWRGKRYTVQGDAGYYNGSRRTAHVDYRLRRS